MKTMISFLLLILSLSVFSEVETKSQLIPHPFYQAINDSSNEVRQIINGWAALQIRLEMIERAKNNIEVEYFIYNDDLSGKIFTRELAKAAARGVKVRILVDKSIAVFKLNKYFAKEFANHGLELRYYNKAPVYQVSTMQFRNHRKLLSVDDQEAITGGRNIGDDYFDLSDHFNFQDTDIYVRGPIVKTMRESFDAFYEHKISERPKFPELKKSASQKAIEKYNKKMKIASSLFEESAEELAVRQKISTFGKKLLESRPLYVCPETTFASDAPGATFARRIRPDFALKYKFLRKALYDKISVIDKALTISSPYMLSTPESNQLMKLMLERNVDITLYTNSLASTDAVYVAANMYNEIWGWVKKGINVYLHDGKLVNDNPDLEQKVIDAKWGTHSKVMVYESTSGSEAMIGTYNIDNRSNFYNAEMALFCKGNEDFSQEVKNDILHVAQHGIKINKDKTATNKNGEVVSKFGTNKDDLLLMRAIFLPSWLLKFLL